MSERLYGSDTHIGHLYMSRLRGFAGVEEHDEAIIDNWNRVVGPRDTVILAGDAMLGDRRAGVAKFQRMHGRKILITGNHDDCWPGHSNSWQKTLLYREAFDIIQQFARLKIDGQLVMISHFPYTAGHTDPPRYDQYRLRDEGEWLLHGHTHSPERRTSAREIHIGMDAWGLTPVPEYRIIQMMRNQLQREAEHAKSYEPEPATAPDGANAATAGPPVPALPDGEGDAGEPGAAGHP